MSIQGLGPERSLRSGGPKHFGPREPQSFEEPPKGDSRTFQSKIALSETLDVPRDQGHLKEHLVARVSEWPGVHAAPALLAGTALEGVWVNRTATWPSSEARRRDRMACCCVAAIFPYDQSAIFVRRFAIREAIRLLGDFVGFLIRTRP